MKSLKLSAAAALALTLALSAAADARESAAGDITIRRDSHGMPHVYAGTVADLFHGYGYAVAQDRLFQMEMARRSTQGTVAEVLGEKFVAFDKSIRGNFSPERIRAQIDALPRAERDILEGYASGMNAWLREVRKAPAKLLPKQFNDLGFQPADWTAYDVAMVFVGTMANRFSDANGEIDNLALLTALTDRHGADTAWQIFNQLKWSVDPKAATTVPAESGSYNFFGVPQGSPEEARAVAVTMNRGTENNMTVFAPQGVRAVDVVAPGQSGFVAPDGEVSPHTRDQFDLYVNFGHKPVWFTPDEVRRDTRSTTRLHRSEKAKPSTNKGDKP